MHPGLLQSEQQLAGKRSPIAAAFEALYDILVDQCPSARTFNLRRRLVRMSHLRGGRHATPSRVSNVGHSTIVDDFMFTSGDGDPVFISSYTPISPAMSVQLQTEPIAPI